MYRSPIPRGVVLDRSSPSGAGRATATNPNRDPQPQWAGYFPSYWEPKQRRPLIVAMHGTTNLNTHPTYYRDMLESLPSSAPNGGSSGSIGATQNGPDFKYSTGTTLVPVPTGFSKINPTWVELAEAHNFGIICPKNYYAGSNLFNPFLGTGGAGRAYDIASINNAYSIIAYLISVGMLSQFAEKFIYGHSSGGSLACLMAFYFPGLFTRMFLAHNNYADPSQALWNYNVYNSNRFIGRTWDWSETDGFTNVQSPCDGGATTSYNQINGLCDLTHADNNYQTGAAFDGLSAMYTLVVSGDNGTDGDGSSTYCAITDTAMAGYMTALGYNRVFTVEYPAAGQNAFTGFDPATYGPTVAVTGQRFYPHAAHDFAKVAACTFFFDPAPNATRYT